MSLAQRTARAISWNLVATAVTSVVLFARSVVLARLLPVEVFGVYAGAMAAIGMTFAVANFGTSEAFLHRSEFSADEEQYARQHFSLRLILTTIWAVGLLLFAWLFLDGADRLALSVMTIAAALTQLGETPTLILQSRVEHKRLAIMTIVTAISSTLVAVTLAFRGHTLWALLSTDIVALVVTWLVLYGWRPVWRPRLGWSGPSAKYFLSFGSRSFVAGSVSQLLNYLDDVWVRTMLGAQALGLYSRAYTFANLPRSVIAVPFNAVVIGAYAELKDDRVGLSRYYFRINALLVRVSFLAGGMFVAVAPEFIYLVLGEKWMPMVWAFRLMIALTVLSPMRGTVGRLFIAVGKPGDLAQVNLLQLALMVLGLFVVSWAGPSIEGVALVTTLVVVVGIGALLFKARPYVGISNLRLFAWPFVALLAGMVSSSWIATGTSVSGMMASGAMKLVIFGLGYLVVLGAAERDTTASMIREARRLMGRRAPPMDESGEDKEQP
jgi:O-antigen/teichoic acid export membrane protein